MIFFMRWFARPHSSEGLLSLPPRSGGCEGEGGWIEAEIVFSHPARLAAPTRNLSPD